jgi:hypothetical protein
MRGRLRVEAKGIPKRVAQCDRQAAWPGAFEAETVGSSLAAPATGGPGMLTWTLARSHVARAIQTGQPPETIKAAREEYRAARLAHLIAEALPHLTGSHRAELAGMLLDGGAGDAT